MNLSHTIETPTSRAGAVSILRVCFDDPEDAFSRLDIQTVPIGGVRLVSIFGLDEALIARFELGSLLIMPHGGIGVTRRISMALEDRGFKKGTVDDPSQRFREADSLIEARMLDALSRASSPLAVDVLLAQPARWKIGEDQETAGSVADAAALGRLIVPAMVVVVGRSNIGKSSLVNTLAGADVSLVVDHEGTTRDHVGVLINLGGLVVRWIDTPGIDDRVEAGGELDLMASVLESADLIVHAIDAYDKAGTLDPKLAGMIPASVPMLRLGIRCDLQTHRVPVDQTCSSKTRDGVAELAAAVHERLVPQRAVQDPRPWRFWTEDG